MTGKLEVMGGKETWGEIRDSEERRKGVPPGTARA